MQYRNPLPCDRVIFITKNYNSKFYITNCYFFATKQNFLLFFCVLVVFLFVYEDRPYRNV